MSTHPIVAVSNSNFTKFWDHMEKEIMQSDNPFPIVDTVFQTDIFVVKI